MGCCESISTESLVSDLEAEQAANAPRNHGVSRNSEYPANAPRRRGASRNANQTGNKQQRRRGRSKNSKKPKNVALPKLDSGNSEQTDKIPKRCRVLNIFEILAEQEQLDLTSAKNIVNLFKNEDTIPFVCRYRRDLIGREITPEKLRNIKINYTEIMDLKSKVEAVLQELDAKNELNDEIQEQITSVRSKKELEFLSACYKRSKRHPKQLETHAFRLMLGQQPPVQLETHLDQTNPALDTLRKVKLTLTSIICDQFSKHPRVMEALRRLPTEFELNLKCTKYEADEKDTMSSSPPAEKSNESSKFEPYFNCDKNIHAMKPHQVLAINRGEKGKFLTVEIVIPEECRSYIKSCIDEVFMAFGLKYQLRIEICDKAFLDCYNRSLKPLLCSQIRGDLTAVAENAAIKVFADNLRQLLLTPPLKGERILGIDPGFTNGCKLALISETANVLEVGILHPHDKKTKPDICGVALANMLKKHNCKVIALGNGTACRETETWLANMFAKGILNPDVIHYTIVSEHGTSVYSCSKEAQREFPQYDVTIISAISIARRLADPLSEYVKMEPRNLGIGMYQHDIEKDKLNKVLNEVVSECVSFVGVDINTASFSILKHVAGLNEECAAKIIEYRQKNGPFRTRRNLLDVHSVGKKRFKQCAGFIRIEPKSVGTKITNMLDCTWVHPESYNLANTIIKKCNLNVNDVGKPEFITKIRAYTETQPVTHMASELNIHVERLQVVLDALQRELSQDFRPDFNEQLFRKSITKFEQISVGCIITGKVTNVVDFGAFLDVGLGKSSLIHNNHMNGVQLKLGDRISAEVTSVDLPRQLLKLKLVAVL